MRAISLLLLLALLAGCAVPARSGGCAPLSGVVAPIETARDIPAVLARINGDPVRLALSGGLAMTVLEPAVARRLALPSRTIANRAASGGQPASITLLRIARFELGRARFANLRAFERATRTNPYGAHADGAVAINELGQISVDFDLPHRRVALYQGGGCTAEAFHFTGPVVRLPMLPDRLHRPVIAVEVDGRIYHALLDPALPGFAISARVAGLHPPADAAMAHGPGGTDRSHYWAQQFKSMRIGLDHFRNIKLGVVDQPGMSFDMIIGLPYFHFRRVVLSMPDRAIFIETPVGAPAPKISPDPAHPLFKT